ncbi:MAG: methyltransferase domain-containing protein [Mycobacteriales bacterium]
MSGVGWSWDPSLYSGSAAYYGRGGRVPYPAELAESLAVALHLDGSGQLLDVGCGPGSLTLLLAPLFEEATGVDADPEMIAEAGRLAADAGVVNVVWRQVRAEDLPAGLGICRLITFAQSFHWMDRPKVAAIVRDMLDEGGACVHVHATTHAGVDTKLALPNPEPPRRAINDLVHRYLGPIRRAGQGVLIHGTLGNESDIYRVASFGGPERIEIPGRVVTRSANDVVASVFSLSSSAPHLFGEQLPEFTAELRHLLRAASPTEVFSEYHREIALDIWRPS